MIAKKVRRAHAKRGKAAMIAALFDYVTATEDKAGTTKCAYTLGANFLCGSLHAWRAEMIALAQESVHSPMPVSHWVLSWQEAEIPSEEQCREALQIFLEGMGLSGHQAVLALHRNTGNVHAHILVNRVNPVTEKTVQPHKGFDIEAAHRIVARIEHAQGWQPQANARYLVNGQGEVERVVRQTAPTPTARAQAYEQATGAKSAMRIAQERAPACIDAAHTWQELHHALAHVGLRFVRKGSGAVLLVGAEAVKASSVNRAYSLNKLCRRLGEFEEGAYPESEPVPPQPVSEILREEWQHYQHFCAVQRQEQARQQKQEETDRQRKREMAQRKKEERAQTLRTLPAPVRRVARHLWVTRHGGKKRKVKAVRPPRFGTWLRQHAPYQEDVWRFRRRCAAPPQPQVLPVQPALRTPYATVRAYLREKDKGRAASPRYDHLIALHLRLHGYDRARTLRELHTHSPELPPEAEGKASRTRFDTCRRIVDAAYGVPGDMLLQRLTLTPERLDKLAQAMLALDAQAAREREAAGKRREVAVTAGEDLRMGR